MDVRRWADLDAVQHRPVVRHRSDRGCARPTLSPSARPAEPAPPAPCGGCRRPDTAFPFRSGQKLASLALSCDARSVGMSTSLAITLGKQQGVRVHRDQSLVAQGARVGLRLHALRRAHLPPPRAISHGSSLEAVLAGHQDLLHEQVCTEPTGSAGGCPVQVVLPTARLRIR